jgi:hypothetical protein
MFGLTGAFQASGTDAIGLGWWQVVFSDDGASPGAGDLVHAYPDYPQETGLSGSFSHALVAGHTYTVGLLNLDGFSMNGDTTNSSLTGSENGQIDWAITSGRGGAPEPSAWALAIVGFGLAGAALRRRRISPSPKPC